MVEFSTRGHTVPVGRVTFLAICSSALTEFRTTGFNERMMTCFAHAFTLYRNKRAHHGHRRILVCVTAADVAPISKEGEIPCIDRGTEEADASPTGVSADAICLTWPPAETPLAAHESRSDHSTGTSSSIHFCGSMFECSRFWLLTIDVVGILTPLVGGKAPVTGHGVPTGARRENGHAESEEPAGVATFGEPVCDDSSASLDKIGANSNEAEESNTHSFLALQLSEFMAATSGQNPKQRTSRLPQATHFRL